MTITIQSGWWIVPLLVTIVAFAWFFWADNDNVSSGRDYGAGALISLFLFCLALIVSLAAWLVWALAA